MTSISEETPSLRARSAEANRAERGTRPPTGEEVRLATWFLGVLLFGLLLTIFLALVPGDALLRDPDIYWDIATGRKIWETGSAPRFDEFSYTFRGHSWIVEEWLSQLLFFAGYVVAGWRGIVLLAATAIAGAYTLLFLTLARSSRVTVALGIALVALAMSFNHFIARPHLFGNLLLVAWLAGLLRAVESRKAPSLALLPIMVLWANMHSSFPAGLGLAAGLAVEAIWSAPSGERARDALRWVLFLALSVGAACVTPYGYGLMLVTARVLHANEGVRYIQEWAPVSLKTAPQMIVCVLVLIFVALCNGVKMPIWRAFMLISLSYFSLTASRFTDFFSIVLPFLIVTPLLRQFKFLRLVSQIEGDPHFFRAIAKLARRALYPVYGATICLVVAFCALRTAAPDKAITPDAAVDYMQAHDLRGKIYNSYDFGGYLIFRNVQTFIDGRTNQLFVDGFMDKLHDVIDLHPRRFIPYLDGFDINLALVIPDSMEAQELEASPVWQKVYSDADSELFQKRS